MNHSFDLFRPMPGSDDASALKLEATRLQDAARAKGTKLSRSAALEAIAKLRGYKDWNTAAAAVTAAAADRSPGAPWRKIDAEIHSLPMRIVRAGDPGHAAVREVMRWAQQMDAIADKVADEDRASMLELIGGDVPYVFVQDSRRWPDPLYRLCDRGYEPFATSLSRANSLRRSVLSRGVIFAGRAPVPTWFLWCTMKCDTLGIA